MFPMIYGVNWVLNRILRFRVAVDGERQGMDLHELGANAYPELVSYTWSISSKGTTRRVSLTGAIPHVTACFAEAGGFRW